MSDGARRLKANRQMAGQTCAWCEASLELGDDIVRCDPCTSLHHAACWDQRGGCRTEGCANAPLKQLAGAPAAAPAAGASARSQLGKTPCPHCGHLNRTNASVCRRCHQVPTPDGIYHGPTENAPGAVSSLVFGIVGLFICGLILGIIAISKSNSALKLIASDPRYKGKGMAIAGRVLGIIALVGWALVLLARIAGS